MFGVLEANGIVERLRVSGSSVQAPVGPGGPPVRTQGEGQRVGGRAFVLRDMGTLVSGSVS